MALIDTKKRKKRRRKKRPVAKPRPTPTPAPPVAPPPTPTPSPPSPPVTPIETGAPVPLVATPAMGATLRASARERLFLNRFGTGFSQRALAQLRAVGTPEQWLAAQLTPERFVENPTIATIDGWYTSLRTDTAPQRWSQQVSGTKGSYDWAHELGCWTILRRIYSERMLVERMTGFWSDVLHVPAYHDKAWIWRHDYDTTIRQRALGTYEELLLATALHPAMRLYLDNWKNVRDKPNENQGRELLELHTVGHDGGYTEEMVKDSARILSGYTVDWATTFAPRYDAATHATGAVAVLGFSHANSSPDGRAVTEAYLRYLARHPATARNIATRMAVHFVGDRPSPGLVDTLTATYLDSGTSIPAMLRTLASHVDFAASGGQKLRTAVDDLVATARVLQVQVTDPPSNNQSYAHNSNFVHGGAGLFSWPRPDGSPANTEAWASVSRIFGSFSMHFSQAGGYWPKGAAYTLATAWLPSASLSFRDYVDHLCQRLLGRAADARLLLAASQATDTAADAVVDKNQAAVNSYAPILLATLLDSPDHLSP